MHNHNHEDLNKGKLLFSFAQTHHCNHGARLKGF